MIRRKIRSIFYPEEFQGWTRKKTYFEGWYYKLVSPDEAYAFAVIPGIAIEQNGSKHAFIQVLDGKKRTASYHRFDSSDFVPSANEFKLSIAENHFSGKGISLDLPELKGELTFSETVAWPNRWYSPGIMGPYSFLPFMECYHGIVSMDHSISGQLEVYGKSTDFESGRGYTEKDWGRSFPSAYVWMQSNHFAKPGISIKVSVAKIPYMNFSFVGFIAGIWLENKLIQFTTYNQSSLKKLTIDSGKVEMKMQNRKYLLDIRVIREASTELASPILGLMDGRIEESMNSVIEVKLTERSSGKIIFEDAGRNAGLEVAGKIQEIILP